MYWKIKLDVPKGIKYLTQWNDFNLQKFPDHSIIHKQIPGCGFTEFALTCPENVVLSSPRRMLMENKKEQHGDDVFLVVNEFEFTTDIDEDISKPIPSTTLDYKNREFLEKLKAQQENAESIYSQLFNQISEYITKMRLENKPIKIIVTYDSTYLVKQILESMQICDSFYFCIDEFQSILEDSRFKSSVELEFLYVLNNIKHVLFVSATPMLDKYIQMIQELNTIPYYELDWKSLDPSRVKKPNLKVRTMPSVGSKMEEIIQTYLSGNFEKVVVERDNQLIEVESREAVFYVNSVNHIINIIKRTGLTPDQCNILCSNTPDNQTRIHRKLGKKNGYFIGRVPLRGEIHKMFTFCTRTVYLGADFYSTCARSFIFSDSNSDCLSIDISIDLAQILGRERLEENPWKNCAEFYYKATCDYKKMTQGDLNNIISAKLKASDNLLLAFSSAPEHTKMTLAEVYKRDAAREKYKDNYVAVNRRGDNQLQPVLNNLVMINEQRAFDIQQVDYADRFAVFSSLNREFSEYSQEKYIDLFFSEYDQLTTYVDKIHLIVDYLLSYPERSNSVIGNLSDSDKIKQQLITVGAKRIKGLGYNITKIKQAMGITIFDKDSFMGEIYGSFIVGGRYTKKYIKEKLGNIYTSADFQGTPKASDLEKWFEVKEVRMTVDGKKVPGFEIIKKK